MQAEAVETLARFDDPRVPQILLRGWPGMSPSSARRPPRPSSRGRPGSNAFLDAVEKGTIGRADLDPARLELLKSYPDAAVRARAGRLFAAAQARRQDVVAAYQKALQLKGDPARGKEVFKAHARPATASRGSASRSGADLSAIRDRGLDAVLLNILDPNREVMPQFLSYVLVTTTGRVLTGMIAAETANSLTIRQPDGREETVLRIHIDELRSTGLSYMPEGLEKQIDVARDGRPARVSELDQVKRSRRSVTRPSRVRWRRALHYLLFYDVVEDYVRRREPLRACSSRALLGPPAPAASWCSPEPSPTRWTGPSLLFRGDSPAVAESFAAADPYVAHGLVTRWRVRTWTTVVGDGAAVSPSPGPSVRIGLRVSRLLDVVASQDDSGVTGPRRARPSSSRISTLRKYSSAASISSAIRPRVTGRGAPACRDRRAGRRSPCSPPGR